MKSSKYLVSIFLCLTLIMSAGSVYAQVQVEPDGPLVYHSYMIDDDTSNPSNGNGDGDIDPGETIELKVFVGNIMDSTATGVNGAISSLDAHVSFGGESSSNYADIIGWGTQGNTDNFQFSVNQEVPCGYLLPFNLEVSSTGNEPDTLSFTIPVTCDPPNVPGNPSPGNGETGVSLDAELSVYVSDPDADELSLTFYGREISQPNTPEFDIVAIPDTQYYTCDGNSSSCPNTPFSPYVNDGEIETFYAQIQWIVNNKETVAFVPHVGDLVQNADWYEDEWMRADTAMDMLETGAPEIPYAIAFGNHDLRNLYGSAANVTGDTFLNQYFGVERFQAKPFYGSHFAHNNNNHYVLFERGGLQFISIHLEYDRDYEGAAIAWADDLLKQYPSRRGILVRHALIDENGAFAEGGDVVFDALKHNPNLSLLLSGHIDGEFIRTDQYNGRTIYTILSDYQEEPNGGDGWLRRLRFLPDSNQINVRSYSPIYDEWDWDDPDATGEQLLDYDMGYTTVVIATINGVTSDSVVTTTWSNLLADQRYEWYAAVSDGTSTTISPLWNFTTTAEQVICYPLTLSYTGSGTAPTASPTNSTGCSNGEYIAGEVIDLTANPAQGYKVNSWTGTDDDNSKSAVNQVTMPGEAHEVLVHYEKQFSIFIPALFKNDG